MRALRARVRGWSRSQRSLRLGVVLGPAVALLAAVPAGDAPPVWLVVIVAVMSVGFALQPDGGLGTAVLAVVVGWWCVVPGDGLHPAVLLAAAALVATHVAAVLAAYAPPEAVVDAALLRLWARRGALVLLAAPLAWVVAVVVHDREPVAGLWPAGLAVAVVLVVLASVLVRGAEPAPVTRGRVPRAR